MASLKELETEINKINQRNEFVEADKAWETSITRKFIIAAFTYTAVAVYLQAINVNLPWLNAIVPTAAFLLSTMTLPFFKKIWLKQYGKKKAGNK
jgi:hypothetical protein